MKKTLLSLLSVALFWAAAPVYAFDFEGTLGTGLTTTTNPGPNTLSTVSPYPNPIVDALTVSSAWTTQGVKMLLPTRSFVPNTATQRPIRVSFNPSAGAAVTYTICVWAFNEQTTNWGKFASGCNNYTGPMVDFINTPGTNPLFLNISALSTGTLSIYYDNFQAQGY